MAGIAAVCIQETARRFCSRTGAGIASLLLIGVLFAPNSYAQENGRTERQQRPGSLLGKVDLLQRSVRSRLKSALGVKNQEQVQGDAQPQPASPQVNAHPQANDPRYKHRPADGSIQTQPQDARWQQDLRYQQSPQPTQGNRAAYPPHDRYPENQGFRQGDVSRTQSLEPAHPVRTADLRHTQDPRHQELRVDSLPARPVEYQEPYERLPPPPPITGNPSSRPMPPAASSQEPMPNSYRPSDAMYPRGNSYQPTQSRYPGDYANDRQSLGPPTGATQNQGPLPHGSVLGNSQVTATQHALRLIEENGDLKARIAMIDAENKRLRDKLQQTEGLLTRSTNAVEDAHREIDAMSKQNADLQRRLNDSERKHSRYLSETDRMLQSIREELDDVLVREISAKGN